MASSDTLTFDDDPPHRAGITELGGGAKENNVKFPPDPVKHMTSQDCNQFTGQHGAFNRMTPLARLFVRFAAGVPSVYAVQAAGSLVVAGDFTVVDNGAGDTTVWWTTGVGGKLPAAIGVGGLTVTEDVAIDEQRALLTSVSGNPAVRVKTKIAVAGTDAQFVVEIY